MIDRDNGQRARGAWIASRRLVIPALAATAALAGCSSSTHSSVHGTAGTSTSTAGISPGTAGTSASTAAAAKSTFCSSDIALDKAQSGVTSSAQELKALRSHASLAQTLGSSASKISDQSVARAAQQISAAVSKALSSGSANFPPSISTDASTVNTYCGVQFDGKPLPSYFATGKSSPACARYTALNTQLRAATSAQSYLSLIESNQAEIAKLVAQAPATIKSEADTLKAAVDRAVNQKSLAPLQTASASQATGDVQMYCGIND